MNDNEFTLQDIIALKHMARQGNEIRPIRQSRGLIPIIGLFLGLFFLAFSITIIIGIFFVDKTIGNNEKYIFIGFSIFLFLMSIIVLLRSFRNMLGKSKPIITLKPDGFIVPKGNKFIPWNLLVEYNMVTIGVMSKIIEFKVAKTLEDKELYFEKKSKKAISIFEKSIYKISVAGLGFEGLTSDKMMDLIKTYIEADAARQQLQLLNVDYN